MGWVSFREDDWEQLSAGLKEVMNDLNSAADGGDPAGVRGAVRKAREWIARVDPLLAKVDAMAEKVASQPEFQSAAQLSVQGKQLEKLGRQIVHLEQENKALIAKNRSLSRDLEICRAAVDALRN